MIPFRGASLNLRPYQKLVVLNPGRENDDERNPFLYGDVVLSLPSPRAVQSLVVRHVVKYTLTLPGHKRQQGVLQTSQVDIPLPAVLKGGDNSFSWDLQVPAHTVPRESAATGSVTHMLQAVAVGAGFAGGDLQDEVEVYMVHGHEEASSTLLHLEGVNELGPYSIDLDSPHLTVGGLLRFHLRLAHAPHELQIRSISLAIEQTASARPPSEPLATPTSLARRIPIFFLGHTTPRRPPSTANTARWTPGTMVTEAARPHDGGLLAVVPAAQEVNFDYVARLPDHRALRPTTDAASRAFVRVAHEVVVQVRYRGAARDAEQIVSFSRPLSISYCCCRLDAVLLPVYGQDILQQESATLGCSCACACTLSAERLWAMHGGSAATLNQADSDSLPLKPL